MSTHVKTIALTAVGVLLTWGLVAQAQSYKEEAVKLDDLPAAVKAAILKAAGGAKITEIERETKNGKVTYEAEFMENGQEVEIQLAPDGTILGREIETEDDDEDDLTIAEIPPAAIAALQKLAGGADFTELERDREGGVTIYEAEWDVNGVQHEAAVLDDGTLLETEETVAAADAPAGVRAAIAKHFGDAKVVVEKKMVVVYEIEAKVDGREKEIMVLPTGRVLEHGDDDDDHDGDDDDDDDGEDDDE